MPKVKIAVSLLAVLSIVSVSFGDPYQDAKNAGSSLGSSFLGNYGSKGGIQQNISNPMTSSNTPMTTMDGSKQFNAQLSCPSSKEFLNVFIQPSYTGDLSTVIVSQDTNMDGTTDYSFQLPVLVSGVCANGFISCTAGTWANCAAYKWTVDMGRASAASALITDLGGCYCINNSCGTNLVWNNLSIILKDLGGGVAGALQASYPQLTVSDVKIDGTLITYYGQKPGNCTSAGGGTGTNNPEQYYSNWPALNADTETTKLNQAQDPTSYYSMISNSPAATDSNSQLRNCTISRIVQCQSDANMLTTIGYIETTTDGCSSLETDTTCRLKDETIDGVETWLNFASTGLSPVTSCMSVTVQKTASCTASSYTCGPVTFTCPLDSSLSCPGGVCFQAKVYSICPEWWEKDRVYYCSTAPFDFSDAQRRIGNVVSTTTDNTATMYYQDLRKNSSGSWIYEGVNTNLPARDAYGNCENACKTRKSKTDTQASATGNTSQSRSTTQDYDFFYKTCVNNSCPLGPGEELVTGCQCIEEFGEAATVMQTLRMGGRDIICSDGVPKPLH